MRRYFRGGARRRFSSRRTFEVPHCDALMLTGGSLRSTVPPTCSKPIVMRASGGPGILKELSDERPRASTFPPTSIRCARWLSESGMTRGYVLYSRRAQRRRTFSARTVSRFSPETRWTYYNEPGRKQPRSRKRVNPFSDPKARDLERNKEVMVKSPSASAISS